jgi:hypothetical protein
MNAIAEAWLDAIVTRATTVTNRATGEPAWLTDLKRDNMTLDGAWWLDGMLD